MKRKIAVRSMNLPQQAAFIVNLQRIALKYPDNNLAVLRFVDNALEADIEDLRKLHALTGEAIRIIDDYTRHYNETKEKHHEYSRNC